MGEITRGETCEGMRLFPLLVWAAGELGTTLGALELQHSKRKWGGRPKSNVWMVLTFLFSWGSQGTLRVFPNP